MDRPRKLANKAVEQWEQSLLLKVMQRKIKCAKSTISALQGTKKSQSQAPLAQKPRACLKTSGEEWNLNKEWNFSDSEQGYGLAETLISHSDQSSKPTVNDAMKSKDDRFNSATRYGDVTTNEPQSEGNVSPQLGTFHDEHEYQLELPNSIDDFLTLTERFHENFKDSDDDLLSHIWSSCKRENALLDDTTGLNQTRRVGASSLHAADFDSSPIPLSKMVSSKERRIPKTQRPHPKKSMVKDPATVSQFMKKREVGWRE